MTPYEQPTDELRQAQHRSMLWSGDWYTFFVVQRKWMVEDDEGPQASGKAGYEITVHLPERRDGWTHIHMVPVWRDIPIVSAEEAK